MNDDDGNVYTLWVGFFILTKKEEIVNIYDNVFGLYGDPASHFFAIFLCIIYFFLK